MENTWNDLYEKYGYPEIPYDTASKSFKYEFVVHFDDINKEIIYNRVLEYASINFDYLANITDYQDYNSGKIILKVKIPTQWKSAYPNASFEVINMDNFNNWLK